MRLLVISLLVAITIISCSKNRNPAPVALEVSHQHGNQAFALETNYANDLGQQYYFTLANIYMGQFTWGGSDPITIDGQYVSVTPEEATYALGELPNGHYVDISFLVGVDSTTNHADPTSFDESSPLHPAHPRYQHWSWNDGYIFIKLEGMADTSASMMAGPTAPFFYHIGLDMNAATLSFAEVMHVHGGNAITLPLTIDYSKFLHNVDFRTELRTHTMNNMALAAKVKNNVTGAITVGQ